MSSQPGKSEKGHLPHDAKGDCRNNLNSHSDDNHAHSFMHSRKDGRRGRKEGNMVFLTQAHSAKLVNTSAG